MFSHCLDEEVKWKKKHILQFKRLCLALSIIKENAKSWISWCLAVYLHNEYSHHKQILLLSYLQTHELLHGSVLHIESSGGKEARKRNGNPIHRCGYTRIYYRVDIKFHWHMGIRVYQRYMCGYVVTPISAKTTKNFIYSNKNLTRGYAYKILPTGTVVGMKFYPIDNLSRAGIYSIHMLPNSLPSLQAAVARRLVAATDEPILTYACSSGLFDRWKTKYLLP
jgi:hypothetical protein